MFQSVRDYFVEFTEKFEGDVDCMYPDIKGLITVGIGNLIDPVGTALDLDFVHKDGTLASRVEIGAEWRMMKLNPTLPHLGWRAAKAISTLHLTPEGISKLVAVKLLANEHYLVETKGRFPEFSTWPADAQLGILSICWACGPAWHWPHFEAACHARNWVIAAAQCHMEDSHNPGLRPRNAADIVLFMNAAAVEAAGADPSVLRYPDHASFPIAAEEMGINGQ